eukprot:5523192-Pleurochrysis_carterae.AAC.2
MSSNSKKEPEQRLNGDASACARVYARACVCKRRRGPASAVKKEGEARLRESEGAPAGNARVRARARACACACVRAYASVRARARPTRLLVVALVQLAQPSIRVDAVRGGAGGARQRLRRAAANGAAEGGA